MAKRKDIEVITIDEWGLFIILVAFCLAFMLPASTTKYFLLLFLFVFISSIDLKKLKPGTFELRQYVSLDWYFSPKGGCRDAIVSKINQAHESIEVYAYVFNSNYIANALIDAKKRGVKVRILADKERSEKDDQSQMPKLRNFGIPTWFYGGDRHSQHNKVMIIDSLHVITGSFNWTHRAEERNAENLLIIKWDKLAEEYKANFDGLFRRPKARYQRRNV